METEIYETGILTEKEKDKFSKFIDNEIGVDYDVNEDEEVVELGKVEKTYYLVIFDLTIRDVDKLRAFELEEIDGKRTENKKGKKDEK